jgi:hypothetical protein
MSNYCFPLFRQGEVPCLDELSPIDERRTNGLTTVLVLAALVLCPAPGTDAAAGEFTRQVLERSDGLF